MSREIKFRAWDTKYKMMLPFDDLDLVLNSDGVFERHTKDYEGDYYCLTDQYILEQYTGLKDKNGKEIYEGDIVAVLYTDWASKPEKDIRSLEQYKRDISRIGCVKYESQEYVVQFNTGLGRLHVGTHGQIVVIGNIHDNPELMENVK